MAKSAISIIKALAQIIKALELLNNFTEDATFLNGQALEISAKNLYLNDHRMLTLELLNNSSNDTNHPNRQDLEKSYVPKITFFSLKVHVVQVRKSAPTG